MTSLAEPKIINNRAQRYERMMEEKDILLAELRIKVDQANATLMEIAPNCNIHFKLLLCNKKEADFDVHMVKKEVERYFNITSMDDQNRKRAYVKARQVLNFILRITTELNTDQIAKECGWANHSSCIDATEAFKSLYYSNQEFRIDFLNMLDILEEKGINTELVHQELCKLPVR